MKNEITTIISDEKAEKLFIIKEGFYDRKRL